MSILKTAKKIKFPFTKNTNFSDDEIWFREELNLNLGFKKVFKVEACVKNLGWELILNENEGRNNYKTFVSPDKKNKLMTCTLFEAPEQMAISLINI